LVAGPRRFAQCECRAIVGERRSATETSKTQKKYERCTHMKERFEAHEWEDLRFLPVAVFFMVALADRKVQPEEVAAFAKQVGEGAMLKDPLHRALVVDIAGNLQSVLQSVQNRQQAVDFTQKTKGFLKAKLSDEEYQRFIGSLFISGIQIAKAAGGGFLGMGDKVSAEEKQMRGVLIRVRSPGILAENGADSNAAHE
jgi:uncharacterized tellurite resistance protein B-like protein